MISTFVTIPFFLSHLQLFCTCLLASSSNCWSQKRQICHKKSFLGGSLVKQLKEIPSLACCKVCNNSTPLSSSSPRRGGSPGTYYKNMRMAPPKVEHALSLCHEGSNRSISLHVRSLVKGNARQLKTNKTKILQAGVQPLAYILVLTMQHVFTQGHT